MTHPHHANAESAIREGEQSLQADPAAMSPDAGLVFIGSVRSPWTERSTCPKNMREARETGRPAWVDLAAPYRGGLLGLTAPRTIVLLSWLHGARRDLIVQAPRHAPEPRGTFALRSPVRPNPIGLHVVRLLGIDDTGSRLDIDAIDVLDGTPLLDIKPYFRSTDVDPDLAIRD